MDKYLLYASEEEGELTEDACVDNESFILINLPEYSQNYSLQDQNLSGIVDYAIISEPGNIKKQEIIINENAAGDHVASPSNSEIHHAQLQSTVNAASVETETLEPQKAKRKRHSAPKNASTILGVTRKRRVFDIKRGPNQADTEKTSGELTGETHIKKIECKLCGKMFDCSHIFRFHLQSHPPEKATCDFCGNSFEDEPKLFQHISTHFLTNYSEEVELISSVSDLKRVLRASTQNMLKNGLEEELICSHCRMTFTSKQALKRHVVVHTHKAEKCKNCGKKFTNKLTLKAHMLTHTGEAPHQCEVCENAYKQKRQLIDHINRDHYMTAPYRCDACCKSFFSANNYYTHLGVHAKNFVCDFCNKSFARKQQLQGHIGIHTGYRPFHCGLCGKSYARKSVLNVHLKTHDDQYPYKCSFCEKAFKYPHSLTIHVRVHTNEKPYKCAQCPGEFSYRISLQDHVRKFHTPQDTLQCSHCPENFNNSVLLRRHLIVKHRKIPNLLA